MLRSLPYKNHAPVAQLDRVLPSEGKGRTFESSRARQSYLEKSLITRAFFISAISNCFHFVSPAWVSRVTQGDSRVTAD